MAVYVDDMRAPYRGMVMCHMMADTTEELLTMADTIGVARRWIQYPGTVREHFDISLSKKKLAIAAGARQVSRREIGQILSERRAKKDASTSSGAADLSACAVCR